MIDNTKEAMHLPKAFSFFICKIPSIILSHGFKLVGVSSNQANQFPEGPICI